ncbi:hypothetical protein N665_0393s0008 [Sinapis alba]|nr:hypothetical protein N665_0393s0008 [Sinapis alba]
MRSVQNICHHFYAFSFVFVLFCPAFSTHVNTLSSTDFLTNSSNRTIVSPGGVFEFGFFKLASSSCWYLGIWYKNIPERSYVWVANRDNPLYSSTGTLKISGTNLVLLDQSKNTVWSTNLTRRCVKSPLVAELFDNGNFVIRYSNNNDTSGYLWQSFDFPTDTLLPQMKLGFDLKSGSHRLLRSWRSPDDPASGEYTYKLETRGLPEFFLRFKDFLVYRTGPWNGIRFSGVPEIPQLLVNIFTENKEEITYTFLMTNHTIYSKLIITPSGFFQLLTWTPKVQLWNVLWNIPNDQCDLYMRCGPYSYCNAKTSTCKCIKGFKPKDSQAWGSGDMSQGCVRKTSLSCVGDGFVLLTKMKLPDTTYVIVDKLVGIKECKKRCLKDCNCTAFANVDIRNGGLGCVIWSSELVDLRNYGEGGQEFYVRLAAADLGC